MTGVSTRGEVAARKRLGSLTWLEVEVPGWPGAAPGQFAMLRSVSSGCFLGRPLSVSDQEGERVFFLIAPVGQGTRELCRLGVGDQVEVVGPLGKGFDLVAMGWPAGATGRLLLVGGGVGVAPFPLLLRSAAVLAGVAHGWSGEVLVLVGFRDQEQAEGARPVEEAVRALRNAGIGTRLEVATEDGSRGRRGTVVDLLAEEIAPQDLLAVCGPPAMSEAVARLASSVAGSRAWFSLETFMACGVGACHGCVVVQRDGSMVRVCREGPVFPWEALYGDAGAKGGGPGC